MKKEILLLLLSGLMCQVVQAQYINNKLNVHFSYIQILASQDSLLRQDNFTTPSLFNNMNTRLSSSLKVTYTVLPFLAVGAGTDVSNYRNWNYKDYLLYKDSEIKEVSFYPVLEFQPAKAAKGFLNTFTPKLQISPMIGSMKTVLSHPPYSIHSQLPHNPDEISSSSKVFKGIKASLGFEMILHPNIGCSAAYGMKRMWLSSSSLYADTSVKQFFVEAGLYFRFIKNKRFYL